MFGLYMQCLQHPLIHSRSIMYGSRHGMFRSETIFETEDAYTSETREVTHQTAVREEGAGEEGTTGDMR